MSSINLDFIENYIELAADMVKIQFDDFKKNYYSYFYLKVKGIKNMNDAERVLKLKKKIEDDIKFLNSPSFSILLLGIDPNDIINNIKAECKLSALNKLNKNILQKDNKI